MMRHARPGRCRFVSVGGTLAVGFALTGAGCFSSGASEDVSAICPSSTAPPVGARAGPMAIGLIGENRLTRFSLASGRVETERRLPVGEISSSDPAAASLPIPGRLLVQPSPGGVVLVMVRRGAIARDEILALDPVTLRTRCRYPLPRAVRYRGLDVGDSGRIYAYGYRERGDPTKAAAVLTTLDPRDDRRPVTAAVRPPNADWFPYWGAVAPDEDRVVLAYHGTDTTGADWFEAAASSFERCPHMRRGFVCVGEVHGAVAPYGDGFLATTGESMVEVAWNGRIVERLPVRPRGVHLVDFVLDPSRGLVYVSSCGEHPAIERLDLAEMRIVTVSSGRVCGVPMAVYEGRFLVLAAGPVGDDGIAPDGPAELRVLDLRRPGPGIHVSASGVPQDAIALGAAN